MTTSLKMTTLSRSEMKKILGGDEGDQVYRLCNLCIDDPLWRAEYGRGCIPWECDDSYPYPPEEPGEGGGVDQP
jgi:hypothetical protein